MEVEEVAIARTTQARTVTQSSFFAHFACRISPFGFPFCSNFAEYILSRLNPDQFCCFSLGVPGGRSGKNEHMPFVTVSVIWMEGGKTDGCSGDKVHDICIVSSGDLHRLEFNYFPDKKYQPFFHNKFFLERDRVVMDCAEQELLRRNREEYYRDIITQSINKNVVLKSIS